MTPYPSLLKEWRKRRRMSQLDLATEADVSARHISFLETGRSRPSPDMILHLSDVMDIPVDARNQMMRAEGFAARFAATPLDDDAMAPIRDAVEWTLKRHEPYPGMVLDRVWRIVRLNRSAKVLFAPLGIETGQNLLSLVTDPVMAELVENWPEVAHHTMLRLRSESANAGGLPELDAAARALAPYAKTHRDRAIGPTVPAVYRFGNQRVSMFGTIAQFSTVTDVTLDDLKIELFFPSDEASAAFLRSISASGDG
ncbi:helix-turn-helix domain-containing protein [Roseibium sp. RKSG952]|uniref:helix-turn-helix domain-containing protein n=1 Tax=Roseibium sp. RKSG952 TaxID=2529384 RepID=UPI0012BD2A8A|nr:helix-turn-helix transcriptional regulator [Roseibium sp. RKSG952]MTI02242.1 XRE family transcriptional regulator [Roseibium sp. RKSG952]